jgi:hypothetical protein
MPTPTYDLIASNVLTSSASSVTFSSIPATYRDLILVIDAGATSSSGFEIQVNSDTGNNYSNVNMMGFDGGTTGSASITYSAYTPTLSAATTKVFIVTQFMDYSATDKHKTALMRRNDIHVGAIAGRWANTNAINTIKISASNIASGSSFYLYGISA